MRLPMACVAVCVEKYFGLSVPVQQTMCPDAPPRRRPPRDATPVAAQARARERATPNERNGEVEPHIAATIVWLSGAIDRKRQQISDMS